MSRIVYTEAERRAAERYREALETIVAVADGYAGPDEGRRRGYVAMGRIARTALEGTSLRNTERDLLGALPQLLAMAGTTDEGMKAALERMGKEEVFAQKKRELPELVVTRDGVPVPDQKAGLEEFKARCRATGEPPRAETMAHETRYSCPVCKTNDPHGYTRCNRPDCTDGRDPR